MIFRSRRPKVRFFSELDEVISTYPIYPAKDLQRGWFKKSSQSYKKMKSRMDNRSTVISSARCPAIRGIMSSGYIVQSWFDFTIETSKEDPTGYKVYLPDKLEDHLRDRGYTNPLISDFDMKASPLKIPTGSSLQRIIKIWTPFSFEVPEGWSLMILPVAYDDSPIFTACPGRITGFAVDFIVHVYWNVSEGRTKVLAGTPLCQIVPVKTDEIPVSVEVPDDDMRQNIVSERLLRYNRFTL